MKIYFGNTLINGDYIIGLTQSSQLFSDTFKLGSTVCRVIGLEVDKRAISSHPSSVLIKDDSDNTLFTLVVDGVDDTNEFYYDYVLTDKMVNLNAIYDWSSLANPTVQNIVNAICTNMLGTQAPTVAYGGNMVVTWNQNITARQFISYVAEINASYAMIDNLGRLKLVKFKDNTRPTYSINISDCADIKIGEYHLIDRVFLELGTATHAYPAAETLNNTVYLNSDNILFTDSSGYTIDGIVRHIYNDINGFNFYCVTTSLTKFNQAILPGDNLLFDTYPSIAQFDWDYNMGWYGGFKLEIDTKKQEETKVDSLASVKKSIMIVVDRELGEITQRVADAEGNITEIKQDALGFTGIFSDYNTVKYIRAAGDGITISRDDTSIENPTELNLDNTGVYIRDSNQREVAAMEADVFRTSEWLMTQTNDNNVFNIFRRR